MTKEELEARLNAAEKEIADLRAKLNEASEIPDYPEFQKDVQYYYLHPHLCISQIRNVFPNRTDDFNAFHTPEYAKVFADKCREIAMLLHCKWHIDRDYVPNWYDDNDVKFGVIWHHDPDDKGKVEYAVDNRYYSEYPTIYFSSKEAAQKAADWMNEHYNKERSD